MFTDLRSVVEDEGVLTKFHKFNGIRQFPARGLIIPPDRSVPQMDGEGFVPCLGSVSCKQIMSDVFKSSAKEKSTIDFNFTY